VKSELGVSERRACRVLGQARSTQRHVLRASEWKKRLEARIVELACEFGRYGYRRITALLQREGWNVNRKRVERIWRREGLRVPRKQPKRGRLWLNDGRPLKLLTMVDEFTRECLCIDVARRLRSEDVLYRLGRLMLERGVPENVRSDNGPEFIATALRLWLGRVGAKTLFIEPGSPWENG
jgi:putative transposase